MNCAIKNIINRRDRIKEEDIQRQQRRLENLFGFTDDCKQWHQPHHTWCPNCGDLTKAKNG